MSPVASEPFLSPVGKQGPGIPMPWTRQEGPDLWFSVHFVEAVAVLFLFLSCRFVSSWHLSDGVFGCAVCVWDGPGTERLVESGGSHPFLSGRPHPAEDSVPGTHRPEDAPCGSEPIGSG